MAISNFPQSGGAPDNPMGALQPQGAQPGTTSLQSQYQTQNQAQNTAMPVAMPNMSGMPGMSALSSLPPVMAAGGGLSPPLPAGQPPTIPQIPAMSGTLPQPRGMGLLGSPPMQQQQQGQPMMAGPLGQGPYGQMPRPAGLGGAWPAAFSPSSPQANPLANALMRPRNF